MPKPTHQALVAFGANLGNTLKTLHLAAQSLQSISSSPPKISQLYYTAPHSAQPQPYYTNAAFLIQTTLQPHPLLHYLLQTEQACGRTRPGTPNCARTLDLDLLLYDDLICQHPTLTLPHPRMHLRNFVLIPACDIAPEWVHPLLKLPLQTLARSCDDPLPITRIDVSLFGGPLAPYA